MGAARNGGRRSGSGRKRGTPNKLTKDLKELIQGALEAVGGQAYLEKVAREQPAVFCALLARVLPLQHAGEIGGTLHVVERTVDRPPEETREQWLARRGTGARRTSPADAPTRAHAQKQTAVQPQA